MSLSVGEVHEVTRVPRMNRRPTISEVREAIEALVEKGMVEPAEPEEDGERRWRLTAPAAEHAFRKELRSRGFDLPAITEGVYAPDDLFSSRAASLGEVVS